MPLIKLHGSLSNLTSYARMILRIFYSMSARMSPVISERGDPTPFWENQSEAVVLSKFLGHLVGVEIESQLRSVENKTLILWGERDKFIRPEWGNRLNHLLPDSMFVNMPGEYHNIATTDTEILAETIAGFVS